MPRVDPTKPTALYRLFTSGDVLLYVGITVEPKVRLRVHSREKTWWHEVVRHEIEWHPDRAAAERAETDAIVTEKPRYNVEQSTTRVRGDASTEYRSPYAKPRQVRIATPTWQALYTATKAAATSRGATITAMIAWWLGEPGAELPERPPRAAWSEAPPAPGP
ncbi:hypothetical protein [Streptomyces synnematoformans]|uniref:GIY-YIG nuclease family protein n=1 Tax=Streptomyces synnematoformans TaxID=415721 RepID=A0ABP5IWY5_9ACTN